MQHSPPILSPLPCCALYQVQYSTAEVYVIRLRLQCVNLSFLRLQKRHLDSYGSARHVALFYFAN